MRNRHQPLHLLPVDPRQAGLLRGRDGPARSSPAMSFRFLHENGDGNYVPTFRHDATSNLDSPDRGWQGRMGRCRRDPFLFPCLNRGMEQKHARKITRLLLRERLIRQLTCLLGETSRQTSSASCWISRGLCSLPHSGHNQLSVL